MIRDYCNIKDAHTHLSVFVDRWSLLLPNQSTRTTRRRRSRIKEEEEVEEEVRKR